MISIITGIIADKTSDTITVMTFGGIGYEIHVARAIALSAVEGNKIKFHTYLKVTDQSQELFGFETKEKRIFFNLLLSVSGVGPRSAMNILSIGSIEQIQHALARGDALYLSTVQGIGKKTAERLVVELKSKIQALGVFSQTDSNTSGSVLVEVIDGLVALGYSRDEARLTIKDMNTNDKDTETLLKEALQSLSH